MRKIIKIFFLGNPFRVARDAHIGFSSSTFRFSHDWLFPRPVSFLSSRTRMYTHIHTHYSILQLPPFCLLFYVPRNTPDILDSNSIARFSPRKSLPSRWLLPNTTYDLTNLSRTCPLVQPVRFQFRPRDRYPPDCCCAIRFKGVPRRKETTRGGGGMGSPSRFRENLKIRT